MHNFSNNNISQAFSKNRYFLFLYQNLLSQIYHLKVKSFN
jgi:hypothetical protein